MNRELPRIADSEWRVMQVLWDRGPQTANDVVSALSGEVNWKPRTVKTLISRLVKKGAVKVTEEGYRYRYSAAVAERKSWSQSARMPIRPPPPNTDIDSLPRLL